MAKVYKTDKLTFLSYGVLVVAYALFMALLVYRAGHLTASAVVMALLVLPVFGYFFFLLRKRVVIDDEGIEVFGLTGRKKIKWNEVSSVSFVPGRKAFLFVEGKGGKLAVIDDSFENFPEIVEEVRRRLPKEYFPENFEQLTKSYKRSLFHLLLLLVAGLVLLFIVFKSAFFG
jgi:Ca2+/Na+ antiporter